MIMRLDKFLSETGLASRKESADLAKRGLIRVDGEVVSRSDTKIDPETQTVSVGGETVEYRKFVYLMLNKPEGYVSSTDDPGAPTVIELLPPELRTRGLFPCGRLDRNTVGFMLLTNDGEIAHRLLSPKRHVAKEYRFKSKYPVNERDVETLRGGVVIEGGYRTMPCELRMLSEKEGVITLHEGKYHQIKLMLKAVCNAVTELERISFAGIPLDPALSRGEFRYLTPEEIENLKEKAK